MDMNKTFNLKPFQTNLIAKEHLKLLFWIIKIMTVELDQKCAQN